ncbi:MAG: hypothetical protein IKE92_06435 [Clostridiales bacterium]|nr:hypothetical protein [Clostridiales bacterium]
MDDEKMKTILIEGIQSRKKLTEISKLMFLSERQAQRKILKMFGGIGFRELQKLVLIPNVIMTIQSAETIIDAALDLDKSSQSLNNFTKRYCHDTPSKIKEEHVKMGKETSEMLLVMAKNPEHVYKRKEIGLSIDQIRQLRKDGYKVNSRPGPSGGYTLDPKRSDSCLNWIRNWRSSMGYGPLTKLY